MQTNAVVAVIFDIFIACFRLILLVTWPAEPASRPSQAAQGPHLGNVHVHFDPSPLNSGDVVALCLFPLFASHWPLFCPCGIRVSLAAGWAVQAPKFVWILVSLCFFIVILMQYWFTVKFHMDIPCQIQMCIKLFVNLQNKYIFKPN